MGDGTEFHGNSLNFPFSFSVSLKLCFENDIGYLKKKIKDGRTEWKCHHGIKPRTPVVWFPLSLSCPKTSLSLHFRASYHEGGWWGHDQHKPPEIKADKEGKVRRANRASSGPCFHEVIACEEKLSPCLDFSKGPTESRVSNPHFPYGPKTSSSLISSHHKLLCL